MKHPEEYPSQNAIKYWAEDDRPREKLLKKGKTALSNSELLAIILGSGHRNATAVDLAKNILHSCNDNLVELGKLSISKLKSIKGIGTVKAITIEAALELGRRRQECEALDKPMVQGSHSVYELARTKLQDLQHEEFWVLYLNRSHKILAFENISKGGITGTLADGRLIFTRALELKSTEIILMHNHPSGSLKPSQQDIELTRRMKASGITLDIPVLDHLIISEQGYFSFSDEGML